MAIEDKIQNSNALTNIFGRWPSFHDAEVLSITLERNKPPCLDAMIQVDEMTNQVAPSGRYLLKNHVAVAFSFVEIYPLRLSDFNH